jgi:hypothetical protein
MPSTNNRVYYASQVAQLRPCSADGSSVTDYWYTPIGLQSVGMTTNFNREQTFQLGTVEIYDNVETVPEVEVTLNKIIDASSPLYLMAMGGGAGIAGAKNQDIVSLSNNRVHFRLGIYDDNKQFAEGAASSYVVCTGMYLSNFTYTLPVDGNATEQVTLVGNSKKWNSAYEGVNAGGADVIDAFTPGKKLADNFTPSTSSGILRRQYFDIRGSVLPTGSGGIGGPNNGTKLPHLQNITFSANLGRESINQLGKFGPYCRYATFPVEVTSEFEIIAQDGDGLNFSDFSGQDFCGTSKTNIAYKTIRLSVCDAVATNTANGLVFDLGTKNTLTAVNYAGGDTGGGNATVTYSFRNFNDFKIGASGYYEKAVTVLDEGGSISFQKVQPVQSVNTSVQAQTVDSYIGDINNG